MKPFELKGEKHFVDDCFNLADHAACLQDTLGQIAYAFRITGNEKISEQLFEIATQLAVVNKSIKEICAYKSGLDTKDLILEYKKKYKKNLNQNEHKIQRR